MGHSGANEYVRVMHAIDEFWKDNYSRQETMTRKQ